MNKNKLNKLKHLFGLYSKIKLVYLFGSRATKKVGPLSDYDFAVYLNMKNKKRMFELKYILQDKIARILKTDMVDIIILNNAQSPELKYSIIKNGKLIYEIEPYKIIIEPKILNEYFDYYYLVSKYNLTGVKK